MGEFDAGRRSMVQRIRNEDLEHADIPIRIFGCVASSLNEYGLGNFGVSGNLLRTGLHTVTFTVPSPAMITWFFPVLVLALADNGFNERVVEVLALTLTHPARHCWWADTWKPILQLQDDLKAEFGEKKFKELWDRGRQLDLFQVAKEIMAEYPEIQAD